MTRPVTWILLVSVGLAPSLAAAEGPAAAAPSRDDIKRAKRMAKLGKRAYKAGEYGDALVAFESAYEAVPKPKYLYNMARAHEKGGGLAEAAELYGRYLREAPNAKDREAVETQADFLQSKLKKTYCRLEVVAEQPNAAVKISGEGVTMNVKAPWSGWLKPGRYDLSALLKGQGEYDEHTQKVGLSAGETRTVSFALAAAAKQAAPVEAAPDSPPPPPAADAEPPAASTEAEGSDTPPPTPEASPPLVMAESGGAEGPGDDPSVTPTVAFGVAAAALTAWGVFALLQRDAVAELDSDGRNKRSRADDQALADTAGQHGLIANVALGVAVASGLAGGVMLVMDPGAQSAGVTWRLSW